MPITPNPNKNIITTKHHINDDNEVDAKGNTSGKLGKRLVDADAVNNLMNRQISTSSVESGYSSDDSINNQSISNKPVKKALTFKSMRHNFTKHFKTLRSEVLSILPLERNVGWVRCGDAESRYPVAFAKAWKYYDSNHTLDPFHTANMAIDLNNITQELGISATQNNSSDNTEARYTIRSRSKLANEEICELVQAAAMYVILLDNDLDKAKAYIHAAQDYCEKIDKYECIYKNLQDAKYDLKINMEPVWKMANGIKLKK